MSKTILFLLLVSTSFVVFSQQLDTATLYKQLSIADKYFSRAKYDSAQIIYNQALADFEKLQNSDSVFVVKYASCYRGLCFTEINQNKNKDAQSHFDKAESIISTRFGLNSNPQIDLYNRIADVYIKKGDMENLLKTDLKVLELLKKQPASALRITIGYMNLGSDYQRLGNPTRAIEFLKLAEINYKSQEDTSKILYLQLCTNQAAIYESLLDQELAIREGEKGIAAFESLRLPSIKITTEAAKLYQNVAANYYKLGLSDKAFILATKSLEIKQNLGIDTTKLKELDIGKTKYLIGRIFTSKRDFINAEKNLLEAIKINDKLKSDNSLNYSELADMYKIKGDFENGYKFSKKALLPFLKDTNAYIPLKFKLYDILRGLRLIPIIAVHSDILKLKFEQTLNSDYLAMAISNINSALEIAENISNQANAQDSKENLQAAILPIYERALRLSQIKFEIEKTPNALNETYNLMEKSKAMTLLQAVSATKAEQFNNVPKSVLEEEKSITQKISSLELKIFEQEKKVRDTVQYKNLTQQLFDSKVEKENWVSAIKKNYPDYYQLRFNRSVLNIDALHKLLNNGQSLLEYFVGDTSIYILFVNQFNVQLKKVKKDFPLNGWIDTFRTSMKSNEGATEFTDKSYALYQKLILPIKPFLPQRDSGQKPNQLIIIPDGVLGYLPFEALLTQPAHNPTHFASHKYLINDYIVSYNFSSTLFYEMENKQHSQMPTTTFIGFAPFYNADTSIFAAQYADVTRGSTQNNWVTLVNSGEELYHSRRITNGTAFINKEATRDNFTKSASSARIIHLATHGKVDDKNSGFSFLVFASNRENTLYDSLYVKDIYNQSLNADMVVLSACETGIGKLQRGEGIVSLSRSFAYSGAKSVFHTLWVANDIASKDLMVGFYRNLKKGMTKDAALWQAKIAYLYKAKEKAKIPNHAACNPFFWASFVGVGDMEAMKF